MFCFDTKEQKFVSRAQSFTHIRFIFINKIVVTKFFLQQRDFTNTVSDAIPKKNFTVSPEKLLCLCLKNYFVSVYKFSLSCVKNSLHMLGLLRLTYIISLPNKTLKHSRYTYARAAASHVYHFITKQNIKTFTLLCKFTLF